MKKFTLFFLLLSFGFIFFACSGPSATLFMGEHTSSLDGWTKEQVASFYGPPVETRKRSDGGETYIYKENNLLTGSQTIYYVFDKEGDYADKKVIAGN